jgi:uncharacterized protein YkwD
MVRGGPVLGLLAALGACLLLLPSAAVGARADHANDTSAAAALDSGVLAQLNQIRVEHRLPPLRLSPELGQAALVHTQDMVSKGYFEHNSANGQPFWQRIGQYYPNSNFSYWAVGENMLWTSGQATPSQSMEMWMASPEHRANILNPAWRQIGIAAVNSPSAPGTYGGRDVTVVTTDFGVRR